MVGVNLEFDAVKRSVSQGKQQIVLAKLSFKLLHILYQHNNEIVSTEELIKATWGETVVSQETLKQRIFLLRKALSEAGIEVSIESIRGEGYQLTIDLPESNAEIPKGVANYKKPLLLSFTVFTILIFSVYLYFNQANTIPTSNRVVLWQSHTQNEPSHFYTKVYSELTSKLVTASKQGKLQFIQSQRNAEKTMPHQARQDRAALIIMLNGAYGDDSLRLQIIEPHTSTLLRDDLLNETDLEQSISEHSKAVIQLLNSGKLVLSKKMKINAQHPIWTELRNIANLIE